MNTIAENIGISEGIKLAEERLRLALCETREGCSLLDNLMEAQAEIQKAIDIYLGDETTQ